MASESCCKAGNPVIVGYEPVGTTQKLGDLDVYITGTGPAAIVVIYDIFGFDYTQVFQVCDRLAAAGFLVACPDTFRGKPWTKDRFPPLPEHNFREWISSEGSWDRVSPDLYCVVDHLKTTHSITRVGTLGFCWGSTIAMAAGADPTFSAVGCVHPTFFGRDTEFAEANQAPACILPAAGDPMELLKEVFDEKPYGARCVYRRFDDQTHGFCAARGDWAVPEVAAAATEAIGVLTEFFRSTLL